MTLHETVETAKKTWIGAGIGLAGVVVIFILFRIGVIVKDILFPPKITPPNELYGKLPEITFPDSTVSSAAFQYTIDTENGELPATGVQDGNFPDRLDVFKIVVNTPDLNRLEKAQAKVKRLDFKTPEGGDVVPNPLQEPFYEWTDVTGTQRKIIMNTLNYDFDLTSDYLTSLVVLSGQKLSNQDAAFQTVSDFLHSIDQYPSDIDIDKTKNPDLKRPFTTAPELFDIQNGGLESVTSLSETKAIRIDLYQKDLEYDLETGKPEVPTMKLKLPILYPQPPHSIINFIVASGQEDAEVVEAHFKYHTIERQPDQAATYPIKTAEAAYKDLTEGRAYVASPGQHTGSDTQVIISDVYLAYYLGNEDQQYLIPIIVFQDKKGFFAYVSAVTDIPLENVTGTEPQPTQ